MLVDSFNTEDRTLDDAAEMAREALLPPREAAAAKNRRTFAGLIARAARRAPGQQQRAGTGPVLTAADRAKALGVKPR